MRICYAKFGIGRDDKEWGMVVRKERGVATEEKLRGKRVCSEDKNKRKKKFIKYRKGMKISRIKRICMHKVIVLKNYELRVVY